MLAANRARHAAVARLRPRGTELLRRQAGRLVEAAGLEVPCRQGVEPVEREQVRGRAQLAVLRRRRAELSLRQRAADRPDRALIGPVHALRAAHRDRLDVLGTEYRAAATAAGVATVM